MPKKPTNKDFKWIDVPKTLWFFIDKDQKRFALFFFLLFAAFFYTLVPTYIVGKVVDFFSAYTPGDSLMPFYTWILILGASYAMVALIRLRSKLVIGIIAHHARARARTWGFERLTSFSLEWHAEENTGSKTERISTGSKAITAWLGTIRRDLLPIIATTIGVLVVFLFINYTFTIFILCYLVFYCFVEFGFNKKLHSLSNEYNTQNQSASGTYVEGAGNILAIKALGGEKNLQNKIATAEDITRELGIAKTKTNNAKWRFIQITNGITFAIFLFLIGNAFLQGQITIGFIMVLFTYVTKLINCTSDFSNLNESLIDLKTDLGSMMPIFSHKEKISFGHESFPKKWNAISMQNAHFKYASGQVGLENIDLSIKNGEKIGIAGLSGSGKSTFAKIFLGLFPLEKGSFTIDGKNYYSIAHEEIMSQVSIALQETELFNMSLKENITMMRDDDPKLLDLALSISRLNEVVARLPEGIDAKIGERGYMLSGGERQRLGIARAIYKDPSIIILDEATSALDFQTEKEVVDGLFQKYGTGKTFLFIAHRLGTLQNTDRILVFDKGEIAESGTYAELMHNTDSRFYKMCAAQKDFYTEPKKETRRKAISK